jgi:AraC-like DNA-binding protein
MKVLPFNIPVAHDKTVIVKEETLPHFYPHLHRHNEVQITLIQKGCGALTVGNKNHNFNKNEIYLIGANVPHVFKCAPSYFCGNCKETVQALTIFFNPHGSLSNLFNLPEFSTIKSFFTNSSSSYRVPLHSFADISNLILGMSNTNQMEQLLQFFELLKSLQKLEDFNPLPSEDLASSPSEDVRMSKVYSYITKNYHRDLTLESVAEYAHLSPSSFCRYFKRHTCLTFVVFLNKVRINEACKKLTSGLYDSIAEVATDCGYSNSTNFNRVFRSVTGLSPSSYIKCLAN